MNGPFLSERAIVSPYSSTRRSLIHCARRSFLNPRTAPDTRWEIAQNGHTNRVPCELGALSTLTAHPGLQNRYSTCTGTATKRTAGLTAFTGRLPRAGLRVRATGRPVVRVRLLRDALIIYSLNLFCPLRQAECLLARTKALLLTRTAYGLRRWTICLSPR